MPTTTNYGWTTPADTDLVKDGASAIRTLGTSIDTTTKNLNPSTTLGDIEYRSSSANTNTRLGIGTTGQVLTVSGGVPAWTTISSGGITLISEQTASSSTGIDFTSISGDYKQLLLVWTGINHSAGSTNFTIRFNADSGSNYYTMGLFLEGSSASYNGGGNTSLNGSPFGNGVTQTGLNDRCHGIMTIDNYASTTKLKNFNLEFCYTQGTSTNRFLNYQGVYDSTSAITQINIVRTTGTGTMSNATNTSIRLYGLS
jgi:hypothetical protein